MGRHLPQIKDFIVINNNRTIEPYKKWVLAIDFSLGAN